MYIYFDVNGNLKEMVQEPVREGSVKSNFLYVYIKGTKDDNTYKLPTKWTNGKVNFNLLDSSVNLNPSGSYPMTKLTGNDCIQIPFDNKRDLYDFEYGYKYEVWSVELPTAVMSVTGVVTATIYLYNDNEQLALDRISFNVQASAGIQFDNTMTQSQYSYLYNKYENLEYDISDNQMTFTVIKDTLTNINNRALSSFESNLVTVGTYQAYKITKDDEVLDEELASQYMKHMTGSSFLPKYNYEYPKNTLFVLFDGTVLKPQFDAINGLLLYPMSLPFALKDWVGTNYVPYTGATKDVNLGEYKLNTSEISANGIKSTRSILPVPPDTTPTLIHAFWTGNEISFVKNDEEEYLGTLSFPLSETNDTDVIATQKQVAKYYPVTIEASADLETPYKYNFSLLNLYNETLSTASVTLASEEVTADLEAYVDNAVGTLETELDGRLDTLEAKHVYEHNITVSGSSASYEVEVKFVIVNSSATEINTQSLLATALSGNPRGCSGYYKDKTYSHMWVLCKIVRDDATRVAVTYIDLDNQTTSNIVIGSASVSDTVTQLF